MAFGISGTGTKSNQSSRQTATTAQVAYQLDKNGAKVDATTYSTETQITEEFYVTAGDTAPTVTDGQTGKTVKSSVTLTESNSDYAKYSVTTIKLPDTTPASSSSASASSPA